MQTGMKAGLAIVLAVFLTGIVGFLTAVTPEEEERTHYNQVSDLTPNVDATPIDSYTEYNPISNVTGWADNNGVTIPFKEAGEGITPYVYHHYISSEKNTRFSSDIYQSGMMVEDWNTALESAMWYPLANPIRLEGGATSVTDQNIILEQFDRGHYRIHPDNYTSSARSFSVTFSLYESEVEGGKVVDLYLKHAFTLTFEKGGGVTDKIIEINTMEDFLSWNSSWWVMDTSSVFIADVEVNIPLTGHQVLYAEFVTADTYQYSGIPGIWLNLYNGNLTHGTPDMDPIGPEEKHRQYNGGLSYRSNGAGGPPGTSKYVEVVNDITIDGVKVQDANSDNVYMYMSLQQFFGEDLPNLEDGTTIYMVGFNLYKGTRTFESDWVDNTVTGTFTLNLTTVPGLGFVPNMGSPALVYHKDDQKWYPPALSKNGLYYTPILNGPAYGSDEVFIVTPGFPENVELDTTYPILEYKYVDGNQFVSIANNVTGYWGNFSDAVGGSVNSTPYQNGSITLLTKPGTLIYSDTVFWKDLDGTKTKGTMSLTVPTAIPYDMALVTLDFQAGEYYAQGIVWGPIDDNQKTPFNWTLRPYNYPIYPTFTKDGSPESSSPSYAEELQFSKSGGTKVYVLTTFVQTDPLGRLWGDPTVYLAYYYPDYFDYDQITGNTGVPIVPIRMLFNAFVMSGTSLTINGQNMPVVDGNISFTYYTQETVLVDSGSPNVPPTETIVTVTNEGNMPIKGMAIEWEDGHVYLVFTEQGKTRYDLGEYNTASVNVVLNGTDTGKDTVKTDVISATGTWYWQSNLYTISHETETVLHLDLSQGLNGWGMTMQVSMLLFAAMLIVGLAIVHYYYRDSDEPMGVIDWVIIGAAILLSLGVATI